MAAIGSRQGERRMSDTEWDDLAGQLRRGPALVAVAAEVDGATGRQSDRCQGALMDRGARPGWYAAGAQRRTAERGLNHDHGLGLGL